MPSELLAQVVASVFANGGSPADYVKDLGGDMRKLTSMSAPVLLVPTSPCSVELLRGAHIVVGSEVVAHFTPHANSKQVCCSRSCTLVPYIMIPVRQRTMFALSA